MGADAYPTLEKFTDVLYFALDHDRAVARRLAPVLWQRVLTVRTMDDSETDQWCEDRRAQADKAAAIAEHARRLLTLLPPRNDRHVRDAFVRGYLTQRSDAWGSTSAPLSMIGDLVGWGTNWSTAFHASRSLKHLAREAERWASRARNDAKKPPGPRVSMRRIRLNEWVAIGLAKAGAPLMKSRLSAVARVFAIVQDAAGFPERSSVNLYRDVAKALSHPSVATHIHRRRATGTQSSPKK